MSISEESAVRFATFINARDEVRQRRATGLPKPWTDDPILQGFRFCNVRREDDKVTEWIRVNWRPALIDNPDMYWFSMLLARFVNWPDSLKDIGTSSSYSARYRKRILEVLHDTARAKTWSSAYMITTCGVPMDKAEYVLQVLDTVWQARRRLNPVTGDTLQSFAARLVKMKGVGSFLTGQVVADTKYHPTSPLEVASDWETWCTPGPGSRRGMARILGRFPDVGGLSNQRSFQGLVNELQDSIAGRLSNTLLNRVAEFDNAECLHAQDVQNCLCEFDKYERMRLGEGRMKSTYPGAK